MNNNKDRFIYVQNHHQKVSITTSSCSVLPHHKLISSLIFFNFPIKDSQFTNCSVEVNLFTCFKMMMRSCFIRFSIRLDFFRSFLLISTRKTFVPPIVTLSLTTFPSLIVIFQIPMAELNYQLYMFPMLFFVSSLDYYPFNKS